MRRAVTIALALAMTAVLSAQVRTGQISGRITDSEGRPAKGAKVALLSSAGAVQRTFAGEGGRYRFPSVAPGTGYRLTVEIEGHKTAVRTAIAVAAGGHATLDLKLEPGKPEEEATAAATLSAVDAQRTPGAWTASWDGLQGLPTTRDPWAVLELAPGVLVDRENVGGSESGDPIGALARGDGSSGANNLWILDGVDLTDPAALGVSPFFFDFDAFQEITVTTGGATDASLPTGGIALNMITRRAGSRIGGSARFFLTDRSLQAQNLTEELRQKGVYNTNAIEHIRDFGALASGPIFKGRLWWWAATSLQDIFTYTVFDTPNKSLLTNYAFKLNARPFGGNSLEAFAGLGARERLGTDAAPSKPQGNNLRGRTRWGSPILRVQDEQTFGSSLVISAKASFTDGGAKSVPALDEDMSDPVTYDVGNQAYVAFSTAYKPTWGGYSIKRPKKSLQLQATLFRDSAEGFSHEIKAGFERTEKLSETFSGYAQNFEIRRHFVEPIIDLGEGLVVPPSDWQYIRFGRESREAARLEQTSVFLQDTLSRGRLTLTLGLRLDRQEPSTGAYTVRTVGAEAPWTTVFNDISRYTLNSSLPGLSIRAIDPKYSWTTWSPRFGLAWDVKGDGKTIAKLSIAQYGDIMAVGAYTERPLGLTGGMGFWWNDASGDSMVQINEIFWQYSPVHPDHPYGVYNLYTTDGALTEEARDALEGGFSSDAYLAGNYWDFDWSNPSAVNYDNVLTFYRSDVDPDVKNVKTSPRTTEVRLSLEKEILPDAVFSAGLTYRRYDNFDWAKPFYPANLYPETPDLVIDNTQTWYTEAGRIPPTVTIGGVVYELKDVAGLPWYLPIADFPGETPFRMVDKSRAFRSYIGLDLAFTKRLSKRWLMDASLTFQDQRLFWRGSFIDPTNRWTQDGKAYASISSGLEGKTNAYIFAQWMAKLSGLYQLPGGFSVSATFVAREGWRVPTSVTLAYSGDDPWPGLYKSNLVYVKRLTKNGLPAFSNLSLRVEKSFKLASGRIAVTADVFNVLNSAVVIRAYDAYLGTYYVNTGESVANPYNGLYNEILNPRVLRLGVRFEF